MEQQPHNPEEDHERSVPELEKVAPSEIDLTGAVQQDDALRDVIGDAITEADSSDGQLPEWGARSIARALDNQQTTPPGALHHFAVTGRATPYAMAHELDQLDEATTDDETRAWIIRLRAYVIQLPQGARQTEEPNQPESRSTVPAHELLDRDPQGHVQHYLRHEYPFDGSALDKVRYLLRHSFAEADARGEPISTTDARAVASLLAPLLPPGSEMHRFADTGDAHPALLHNECQEIRRRRWQTPDIPGWLERLEQHLAGQTDLGRRDQAKLVAESPASQNERITRDTLEHGDAFRAFLQLRETDPQSSDLLRTFHEFYVGSFTSMPELLDKLTEVRRGMEAVTKTAEEWGLAGSIGLDTDALARAARSTWDIVELRGTLHVFMK